MSAREVDYYFDAPDEFTAEQGLKQDSEIRKAERDENARVVQEGKERRRQWAQKMTPKSKPKVTDVDEAEISHVTEQGTAASRGMLPGDIVKLLAAREKQVFASDSKDEKEEKVKSKKKRRKSYGLEPIILNQIPHLHNACKPHWSFLRKGKCKLQGLLLF